MAEWPARTWSVGELITAGMFNGVRDELNELHGLVRPQAGLWTDVPLVAGNFGGPAGSTWVIATQTINRWTRLGNTIVWALWVQGTVTGTPSNLFVRLPVQTVVKPVSAHVSLVTNPSAVHPRSYVYSDPPTQTALVFPDMTNPGTTGTFAAGAITVAFTLIYDVAP